MQVDVRALKQALWRSLQEVRAQSADGAELDFQVCIPSSCIRALSGATGVSCFSEQIHRNLKPPP